MDFADNLQEFAARIPNMLPNLLTEEATKNALVLPLLQCLGYNVFDPTEVVPEYVADFGERKGEKVDYAIFKEGEPIILIECKPASSMLNSKNATQLQRYFQCIHQVKFAILTNGVVYQFFSDLDHHNLMDPKPFLEVDMQDLDLGVINQLKKFAKPVFDAVAILDTAGELKYTRELRGYLTREFETPSSDFIRFLVGQVYEGMKTEKVLERFSPIAKRAMQLFINSRLNATLDRARAETSEVEEAESDEDVDELPAIGEAVKTTEEEWQGFYIVKAILSEDTSPSRIVMRDVQSYCGILLDDNNRKPLCRLHFNVSERKAVSFFGENRTEERIPIDSADDIYKYNDRLRATLAMYDSQEKSDVYPSETAEASFL